MGVYVVVSTTSSADVEVCEAYAGAEAALGRAWSLATTKASSKDWAASNPPEEHLTDGSIRWTFLDTSRNFVAVYYRPIETALLSKKDPISVAGDMGTTTVKKGVIFATLNPGAAGGIGIPASGSVAPPPNEKLNPDLPGGWDLSGKPVLMRVLIDRPEDVEAFTNLKDVQRNALVTARISKNPGWVMFWDNHIWTQSEALTELKSKSSSTVMDRIVNFEIAWLEGILNESLSF